MLEDDATFQCQVGAADGISPIRSRDAILTINVPPQPPIIVNGAFLRTTEDREVEIQCESRGGKPAAEVSTSRVLDSYIYFYCQNHIIYYFMKSFGLETSVVTKRILDKIFIYGQ